MKKDEIRGGDESNATLGAVGEGSDGDLSSTVAELRVLWRRSGLERTIAIGNLILTRFFGGSVESWRARSRTKSTSIRRLAQHPECPLSRSGLNQAVSIYVAVQKLLSVQSFGHIKAGHIGLVLALPTEVQLRWLELANAQAWTVRRLRDELRKDESVSAVSSSRSFGSKNAIARVRSQVSGLESAVNALLEASPSDSREDLSDILARLRRVEKCVSAVAGCLQAG